MDAIEAVRIYKALQEQSIPARIEGGWAVEALLHTGDTHGDLDLLLDINFKRPCTSTLSELGYKISLDKSPSKIKFQDAQNHKVTVHMGTVSNGVLTRKTDNEVLTYKLNGTKGIIGGVKVQCVSAEDLLERYSRNQPKRDKDYKYRQLLQNYVERHSEKN